MGRKQGIQNWIVPKIRTRNTSDGICVRFNLDSGEEFGLELTSNCGVFWGIIWERLGTFCL